MTYLENNLAVALDRLEVSANTAIYCYHSRPENFSSALLALNESAYQARTIMAEYRRQREKEQNAVNY